MRNIKSLLFTVVAVLALCSSAFANLTPTLVSIVPDGSEWIWTYSAEVDAAQNVLPGNFFTIYDFAGFDGFVSNPVGWSPSSAGIGVTPPSVLPLDKPDIPNLTWTWTGDSPIVGPSDMGLFSARSAYSEQVMNNFAGRGTRSSGPNAGTGISNIGEVPTPSGTPEPASMAVLGFGCLPFIKKLRKKNTK